MMAWMYHVWLGSELVGELRGDIQTRGVNRLMSVADAIRFGLGRGGGAGINGSSIDSLNLKLQLQVSPAQRNPFPTAHLELI